MKISKKAEYALRAVLAMSRSTPGTIFSIQSLSEEEHIPLKFLEQILLVLRKGGLMHSRRGAGGGYQLVRAGGRITVGEVLELVDGPIEILPDGASVSQGLNSVFQEFQAEMQTWLTRMTMAEVLQREQMKDAVSFEI